MHKTQAYFNSAVISATSTSLADIILNDADVSALQLHLQEDAQNYIYSSAVSMADAVQAIQREWYSWSTVKLYYSLFYALRAILAANNLAIIYHANGKKNTPYRLSCYPGQSPQKLSGTTHKIVIKQFYEGFPTSPLISQLIDLKRPFDWMIDRREEVNYKNVRLFEPMVPAFFQGVVKSPIRQTIDAYINDITFIYTFDPDHAILALPIKVLSNATRSIVSANPKLKFTEQDRDYLFGIFRDRRGVIKAAEKIFI